MKESEGVPNLSFPPALSSAKKLSFVSGGGNSLPALLSANSSRLLPRITAIFCLRRSCLPCNVSAVLQSRKGDP